VPGAAVGDRLFPPSFARSSEFCRFRPHRLGFVHPTRREQPPGGGIRQSSRIHRSPGDDGIEYCPRGSRRRSGRTFSVGTTGPGCAGCLFPLTRPASDRCVADHPTTGAQPVRLTTALTSGVTDTESGGSHAQPDVPLSSYSTQFPRDLARPAVFGCPHAQRWLRQRTFGFFVPLVHQRPDLRTWP